MATIATLNTVFSATTDKFSAGTKAAQRDLSSFERSVDKLQKKLISFEGAFKIGTGIGLGGEVLNRLHHGISRAVTAFGEGVSAGQRFGDTINDMGRAAIGLETSLAAATKRGEELAKVLAGIREGQTAAAASLATTPANKVEETTARLMANIKAAQERASPGQREIEKAQQNRDMVNSINTRRPSVDNFSKNALRMLMGSSFGLMGTTDVEGIREKYKNEFAMLAIAEQELRDYLASVGKLDTQAKQTLDAWAKLQAALLGGAAKTSGGTSYFGGLIPGLGASGAMGAERAAGALGPVGGLLNGIGRTIGRAVGAAVTTNEADAKAREATEAAAKAMKESVLSPSLRYQMATQDARRMMESGHITNQEYQAIKLRELQKLASTLPDPNRRAGLAEFGSQAAFAALNDSPMLKTEKEILEEAEKQTELQRQMVEKFGNTGVVVATF